MDTEQSERLVVKVQLIPDSSLWCWEIWDSGRGEVVESCWARDWAAYDSRGAALSAGEVWLTLSSPQRSATASSRQPAALGASPERG
jgi:hypothetical protein